MDPITNIKHCRLFRYRLALKKPFYVKKEPLNFREGLILNLIDGNGHEGWGEAAPLAGFSSETLRGALHQLKNYIPPPIRGRLGGGSQPVEGYPPLAPPIKGGESHKNLCPSVVFGLESAYLNLIASHQKTSLANLLGHKKLGDVSTACLLQGSVKEVVEGAEENLRRGYRVFKLKVGDRNIPLDIKKVDAVRKILSKDCFLRLDANAVLSFKEAVIFAKNVGDEKISFIEEPFKALALDEYKEFYRQTRMPYALDESLLAWNFKVLDCQGLKAVVIKPTVIGGILKTLEWIKQAQKKKRQVVISSCFESGVGLTMLANLALLTNEPAGLGTLGWFKEDLLIEPLMNPSGVIFKEKLRIDSQGIRKEMLEEIK